MMISCSIPAISSILRSFNATKKQEYFGESRLSKVLFLLGCAEGEHTIHF